VLGIPSAELQAWTPRDPSRYRAGTRLRYTGPLYARLPVPVPETVDRFLAGPSPVVYVAVTSSTAALVRQIVAALRALDVRILVAATVHDLADLQDDRILDGDTSAIPPLRPDRVRTRHREPAMKARIYDAINGKLDRAGLAARRQRLVRDLEGHVLEIGAGTGLNIAHYQRAGSVTVLEPDVRYTRRLRARAARCQIPVKVVIATAETIPLPDNSFDHVVASIALCSVTDPAAALAEVWRVLRPGGTFESLEHTRGADRLAAWQDRLTPLQRRMADGCNLNRDPATVISDTGFRIRHLEHFTMPAGHPLIKPAIQGYAVKDPQPASLLPPRSRPHTPTRWQTLHQY